jgi:serine/threonine-protein kinase
MAEDPRTGKVLQGRYKITAPLAEGGMGIVYRGERVGIGRPVVVKFLHTVLSEQPGIVDRFEREARATARLNHPNCVALVDYGIEEGAPYLVMEYAEGKTLADLLDAGALPPRRAAQIAIQVLAGLSHAHERGILHRDLKPANIMITDAVGFTDFVKILDFGLAKLLGQPDGKRDVTVAGIAIGTPGYMSPEQAAGLPSDRRADIYCTGALLYHLVTGSKAFEGDDIHSVLRRHREETPQKPRALKPATAISNELEAVITRAMQRDAGRRFQNAEEMIDALKATPEARVREGEVAEARRAPRPSSSGSGASETRAEAPSSRARNKSARRGAGAVLLAGVLIGASAMAGLALYTPAVEWVRPLLAGHAPAAAPSAKLITANDPDPIRPTGPARSPRALKPIAVDPPPPTPKTALPTPTPTKPPAAPSPLVALSAPRPAAAPSPSVALSAPKSATAPTPSAPSAGELAPKPAVALSADAGADATTADSDDDDTPAARAEDGSGEDDRTPPPEPPQVRVRDEPQVRTLADVRALIRKGDDDGALAGLYRLRRARPAPSRARGAQIATLIGSLYFDRRWWTDALREYRFACHLEARARRDSTLVNNTVRMLADHNTYFRARRLILDTLGRAAVPALRTAIGSTTAPDLRHRAQHVLTELTHKSGASHRR